MEDFLKSWKKGRIEWSNPFNPKQRKIIDLTGVELVVFWSKFPIGLLKNLEELDFDYYLLFTLNDYPELEKNLPDLEKRLDLFKKLSEILGKDRVIWRFDPIVLLKDLIEPDEIVQRFERILRVLKDHTQRVIISFMTPYRKVLRRLERHGYEYVDPDIDTAIWIASKLSFLVSSVGLRIQSCADRFNTAGELERVGVTRGACIDKEYIKMTFAHNERLMKEIDSLGKDRGQRRGCLCLKSVDVGRYNTCRFKCVYCYAV